jgi:8-oxo-dGTP pyrophosphatase MutT (NUDIX family)
VKLSDFRLEPQQISHILNQDFPYFKELPDVGSALPTQKQASVLLVLGNSDQDPGQVYFLITKRTQNLDSHPGQMAFPGGMQDPKDTHPVKTALRETDEEVGISPDQLEVLGELPKLFTLSSGIWITPVVASLKVSIESVELKPNGAEIETTHWVSISALMEPGVYCDESFEYRGKQVITPVFSIKGEKIWGVTGVLIKNFLDRIQSL